MHDSPIKTNCILVTQPIGRHPYTLVQFLFCSHRSFCDPKPPSFRASRESTNAGPPVGFVLFCSSPRLESIATATQRKSRYTAGHKRVRSRFPQNETAHACTHRSIGCHPVTGTWHHPWFHPHNTLEGENAQTKTTQAKTMYKCFVKIRCRRKAYRNYDYYRPDK